MTVTPELVRALAGPAFCSADRAALLAPALRRAVDEAGADTPERAASLLAHLCWESGQFRFFVESEEAARAYEGRVRTLGNTEPGDGVRFRGRGFIHLTGRRNYAAAGEALGLELEQEPDIAGDLEVAARVAAWFWRTRGLNELVDVGDHRGVTQAINGAASDGPPSYHQKRERYRTLCLALLSAAA